MRRAHLLLGVLLSRGYCHASPVGFCSSEPAPSANQSLPPVNRSLPPAIVSHALVAHIGLLRSCLSGRTQSPGFFHGHTCSDAVTIDIGANNGDDFSVPGAKAGGIMIGFEPVPSTFERFRKYATKHIKNAHTIEVGAHDTPPEVRAQGLLLVRAAAGDVAGNVTMIEQTTPAAFGSSLVTTNVPEKDARRVSVPIVRLDEFVPWVLASASVERPLFLLKVDAQGYEVAVFRGAYGLFEGAGVEYVFLEFSPRMLDRWARQSDAAVAARGVGGAATALLEVGDLEMKRVA